MLYGDKVEEESRRKEGRDTGVYSSEVTVYARAYADALHHRLA